jgi:hypothetical protein
MTVLGWGWMGAPSPRTGRVTGWRHRLSPKHPSRHVLTGAVDGKTRPALTERLLEAKEVAELRSVPSAGSAHRLRGDPARAAGPVRPP